MANLCDANFSQEKLTKELLLVAIVQLSTFDMLFFLCSCDSATVLCNSNESEFRRISSVVANF